ncbi:hypothetical protein [uncultured Amnibacterium sp.]|uniref:hypothetical protein n=1 Tax=uncultured Amnibacterium sp. TaxID=1631851 RepID=UPI0035CADBD9
MKWYSDFGASRTYQIVGDVVAILVVVVGIVLGVTLHNAIDALKQVGANVESSGSDFSKTMGDIGRQLGGVPLIGSGIKAPFDAAGNAGTTLAQAGSNWQEGIERLATLVGWTVALLVLLLVLVGWVRPRLVGAIKRGILARLARRSPDLDLLAFRALANQPAAAVARVDPNAVTAWRRGDIEVIQRLAALELRASGIKLTDRVPGAVRPQS